MYTIRRGGLGFKNLGGFNDALLGELDWEIRSERGGLWFKVLANIYGDNDGTVRCEGRDISLWWVNLNRLEIGDR